jgi:two-component system OmpR family sensor kinase
MAMVSLRKRLLLPLILLPPLCAIPGAYWLYLNTVQEVDRAYDYELIAISRALDGDSITQIDLQKPVDNGEDDDVCIQVWDKSGKLLYHSDDEIAPLPDGREGLQTLDSRTGPWRSYAQTSKGLILQIAQPLESRQELAFSSAVRILLPLLLVLPLWAIFAWITINRGLAPLGNIAAWLNRRDTHSATPLPLEGIPSEVEPMARALNDLLDRLNKASALQRTFIADAAHALRTPLAVLRVQLETARSAPNETTRSTAMNALSTGIERASRLVQQLLTLAKQEPGAVSSELAAPTSLDALLREVIAEAVPLAQAKNIDLGVTDAEPVSLSVDAMSVRALIANLVDNAIRYSHRGGRIDASIAIDATGARIEITDDGPGIPEEERLRVFDRFYRGIGAAETGSGLGLAIAMEIAQRHAGLVVLEDGFAATSDRNSRTGLKVIARLGNLKR